MVVKVTLYGSGGLVRLIHLSCLHSMSFTEMTLGWATVLSVIWAYVFRRKHPRAASRIGFVVIWANAAGFFWKILLFALTKDGAERTVLIVSAVLMPGLVAAYWHRYWQQKRPDKKQV